MSPEYVIVPRYKDRLPESNLVMLFQYNPEDKLYYLDRSWYSGRSDTLRYHAAEHGHTPEQLSTNFSTLQHITEEEAKKEMFIDLL